MASEFWRYFRDVLRWPLIHTPGPLSALVRGKAHSLDETRDDILYFRQQWFPEHCEDVLIPGFGTSRGLVRHVRENAAQFRRRVVNAYAWHMLGGKVQGLPQILRFYGFESLKIENLRDYQPSRWAEFQIGLKVPVSQAEQETLLNDLDALIWLVNEYKPARSVLARIYTDTYNLNPAVWSGEKSAHGWSQGFWSRFSGVDYESQDNPGVVVSFGMAHRFQSEVWNVTGAGLGIESSTGFLAPYLDRPVWSRSFWSEAYPRNHGFTVGEIVSLHWCVRTTASWPWHGGWDQRPWQKSATWDRILPRWKMRKREWARVEAVFSWPGDSREPGEPVSFNGDGTWGDINACYGRPTATIYQGSRWGDAWGANPGRRELEILERWRNKTILATPPVSPRVPVCAGASRQTCRTSPLRGRGWQGQWGKRRWLADLCPVRVQSVARAQMGRPESPQPRLASHAALALPAATLAPQPPQQAVLHIAHVHAQPLHEKGWLGSYANRRWSDYLTEISTRSDAE
ncbi:phage tail protein [Desulfovibrio sp. ZJ200]|uniref:phage tail protein n=1 Tax=Desulfovibrio sp. ZJ200 TaxID=2709792 RepID=UPI0013EB4BF6|nr:phage tail protein [Desulfovibrio sp. ZJ200]